MWAELILPTYVKNWESELHHRNQLRSPISNSLQNSPQVNYHNCACVWAEKRKAQAVSCICPHPWVADSSEDRSFYSLLVCLANKKKLGTLLSIFMFWLVPGCERFQSLFKGFSWISTLCVCQVLFYPLKWHSVSPSLYLHFSFFKYCVESSMRFSLKKRWGGWFLTLLKISAVVQVFRGFGLF